MKRKKPWYVMYVHDSTSKYKKFKSEEDALQFATGFDKHYSPNMSSWVDLIFYAPRGVFATRDAGYKKNGGRI